MLMLSLGEPVYLHKAHHHNTSHAAKHCADDKE
jgi:hypothetical protein